MFLISVGLFCPTVSLFAQQTSVERFDVQEYKINEQDAELQCEITEAYVFLKHSYTVSVISLTTDSGEILYKKINSGKTETRIPVSMFPDGIYYVSIDTKILPVHLVHTK